MCVCIYIYISRSNYILYILEYYWILWGVFLNPQYFFSKAILTVSFNWSVLVFNI